MVSDLELIWACRSEVAVEGGREIEAEALRLAAASWAFWRWREVISDFYGKMY